MRADIRFKVWPNLQLDEIIVERICHIIIGYKDFYTKNSGYKWSLGTTNDWWMDKEGDEFIIIYRNSTAPYFDTSKLEALRKVIIWLLHIEDYNKE